MGALYLSLLCQPGPEGKESVGFPDFDLTKVSRVGSPAQFKAAVGASDFHRALWEMQMFSSIKSTMGVL